MAPIDRYQDWTFLPPSLLVLSGSVFFLLTSLVLIIWLCACCDSKPDRNKRDAVDEMAVERPTDPDAGNEPGKSEERVKKKARKVEFISTVLFDDGKKGRLTKDGTLPQPFAVQDHDGEDKQEKSSDMTSQARTRTGLSLPPSLHVVSAALPKESSKSLQEVKKSQVFEKKSVKALSSVVPTAKTALAPTTIGPKITVGKTEPAKKSVVPAVPKAQVPAPKKVGKSVVKLEKLAIAKTVKPFVVATTVRAPQAPVSAKKTAKSQPEPLKLQPEPVKLQKEPEQPPDPNTNTQLLVTVRPASVSPASVTPVVQSVQMKSPRETETPSARKAAAVRSYELEALERKQ